MADSDTDDSYVAAAPNPALDLLARTAIGEDPTPQGRAAVMHVIMNRLNSGNYGSSVPDVVFQRNAFEPWSSRAGELRSIPTDSPDYQAAYAIAKHVASGDIPDPTGGATYFLNPQLQVALGRSIPAWAQGRPSAVIGKHAYFTDPNASAKAMSDDDIGSLWSGPSASGKALSDEEIGALWSGPQTSQAPGKAASPAPMSAPTSPSTPQAPDTTNSYVMAMPADAKPDDMPAQPSAPQSAPASSQLSPAPTPSGLFDATATGFANGVPIVGPMFNNALDRGLAGIMALASGKPYGDALALLKQREAADVAAHPTANALAQVAGGVAGMAPAVAMAPAAFGVGTGLTVGALGTSALTGAAIGGADAGVRSGGDLGDMAWGAGTGGALGAVGPVLGTGVDRGIRFAANALARTNPAARSVARTLAEVEMTPAEARNALATMGPEATVADLDPALTLKAGALASTGGAPTSILKKAMALRAAGADNRVVQAVEHSLGPRPDLTQIKEIIHDGAQRMSEPHYQAMRANPPSMDVSPVLAEIDRALPNAGSSKAAVLNRVKADLTTKNGGMLVPKDHPDALLNVRQELDNLIENVKSGKNATIDGTSVGRGVLRTAQDLRGRLDSILKAHPDIEAGDAAFSKTMALNDAVNEGRELFSRNTRLPDFQRSLASKSPAEVAAMRQGALSAIWDALDNARRGELAAAQQMFGKASANRAKLDALFPGAGKTFDALNAEAAMRATERDVASNSLTAARTAAMEEFRPRAPNALSAGPAVIGEAVGGGAGAVALPLARATLTHTRNALADAALNRLKLGLARGLVATGPAQDAFLGQIGRAARTASAVNALAHTGSVAANLLTRYGGNALLAPDIDEWRHRSATQ